jgi:hypothetical protein
MKTLKTLLALPLALCAFTGMTIKNAHAALPDLSIATVNEYNTTARVLVRNNSPVWSGGCLLRAYRQVGFGWVLISQVNVPAIPPFQTRWVSVSGNGIQLNPTMYFVDPTNVVAEADETNNRFIVP